MEHVQSVAFRTETDVVQKAFVWSEAALCHFTHLRILYTDRLEQELCFAKCYRNGLVSDGGTFRFVITLSEK